MMPVDPEALFKFFGIILSLITGATGIAQWGAMRDRNKIKADLEILKLYESARANPEIANNIAAKIDRKMGRLYQPANSPRTDLDKSDLFIGFSLMLAGYVLHSYSIAHPGITANTIIVLAIAAYFGGLVAVVKGFNRKVRWIIDKKVRTNVSRTA
jgi:hypothetical protein